MRADKKKKLHEKLEKIIESGDEELIRSLAIILESENDRAINALNKSVDFILAYLESGTSERLQPEGGAS